MSTFQQDNEHLEHTVILPGWTGNYTTHFCLGETRKLPPQIWCRPIPFRLPTTRRFAFFPRGPLLTPVDVYGSFFHSSHCIPISMWMYPRITFFCLLIFMTQDILYYKLFNNRTPGRLYFQWKANSFKTSWLSIMISLILSPLIIFMV